MDADRARALLARERARVEQGLAGPARIESDGDPDRVDASDTAPNMVDAEIDAGIASALGDELAAIERAEQRLANGTYGRSVESDDPIPDARLEAVPWAERTIEEQSRLDAASR